MAAQKNAIRLLDYEIAPLPGLKMQLQTDSLPSIDDMQHEIARQFASFRSLPASSPLQSFTRLSFAPASALEFVLSVNILEDHGTRNFESTRAALAAVLDSTASGSVDRIDSNDLSKDQLKTIGTYTALEASYRFFAEQQSDMAGSVGGGIHERRPYHPFDLSSASANVTDQTSDAASSVAIPMLPLVATPDEIQNWHKLILPSAISHCFRANQQEVFTTRSSGVVFLYLNPGLVAAHMSNFFDTWFATMQELASHSPADLCPLLIRFAAWVLSRFLFIHPFTNGNGRIGRLLVQFILNYICPFPVPIACSREIYLQCIEQSQPSGSTLPDELAPPAALAYLILSSVWRSWQSQSRAILTENVPSACSVTKQ